MNGISDQITSNTLQNFSARIRYNVATYLDLYSYFIEFNQPKIQRYFEEQDSNPDPDSFEFLANLITEANKIENLIKIHSTRFGKIDDWELLEALESVKTSLETIDNTTIYTRSSKSKNSWQSTGMQITHMLKEHETIEQAVMTELNSSQWATVAVDNNLMEKDYSTEGGDLLTMQKRRSFGKILFLGSVVDNLVGEKLYGADFANKLSFSGDDLTVLSHEDTFKQAVLTLVNLMQGDIPEFPTLGRDPSLCTGSNINAFEYGKLKRQLEEIFATDDSIRNFTFVKFAYVDTDVHILFSVDSFYNISIKESQVRLKP